MSEDDINQSSQEPAGWIFEKNLTADSLIQESTDKIVLSRQESTTEESSYLEPWQAAVEQQDTQPVKVKTGEVYFNSEAVTPNAIPGSEEEAQVLPDLRSQGKPSGERFLFFLLVLVFIVILVLLFLFFTGNLPTNLLDGLF